MNSSRWIFGCFWWVLSMTPLQAQDQRDEDIFGGGERPAESPKILPEATGEHSSPSSLIDTLQIGGRLELRTTHAYEEQQSWAEAQVSHVKTADIYFDSRPNKDIRVFLRSRSTESNPPLATSDDTRMSIDEFWFKWDYQDQIFFTYGKQHLKWGSSRFWNPTDFTAREVRDPLALFDRRLGQEMLKIHIPQEKQGYNYYVIIQTGDALRQDDYGLALRGEFAVGGTAELTLSAQTRRGEAQRVGMDLSMAVGPADLTLELAGQRRLPRSFYRGSIEPSQFLLPEGYQDGSKVYGQAVAGLQHTFKYSADDNATMGLEYFHNELGYEDRYLELYSLIMGQSQGLFAGRRYLGAYLLLPSPGSWNQSSWFLNALDNLSDSTIQVRATASLRIYDQAILEIFAGRCFGDYGEFCFQVPESYKQLAQAPGMSEEMKQLIARLPTRKTISTAGISLSMNF